MAGFGTQFRSRTNQYGATANSVGGGAVPKGLHMSPLPAVSGNFGQETKALLTNNCTTQVSPTKQPLGWAELLPSLGRSPKVSRRSGNNGSSNGTTNLQFTPPQPNASLVARLSLNSARTVQQLGKLPNMKSAEATPTMFKARFSGEPSEDWLLHVDRLETERARMHKWTPSQFYFALRSTITGKALRTLRAMEDDMEINAFTDLIPEWFEPSGEDWRKLFDDKI